MKFPWFTHLAIDFVVERHIIHKSAQNVLNPQFPFNDQAPVLLLVIPVYLLLLVIPVYLHYIPRWSDVALLLLQPSSPPSDSPSYWVTSLLTVLVKVCQNFQDQLIILSLFGPSDTPTTILSITSTILLLPSIPYSSLASIKSISFKTNEWKFHGPICSCNYQCNGSIRFATILSLTYSSLALKWSL